MGDEAVVYEFIMALFLGLGALALFVWSVLSGHFEDTEDVKYRVLEREREDGRRKS